MLFDIQSLLIRRVLSVLAGALVIAALVAGLIYATSNWKDDPEWQRVTDPSVSEYPASLDGGAK